MAVNTMEPIKRQEQVTVPQRNKRALRLRAEHSRSWLLISAAGQDAFTAALCSEADSVILDLEDAVPADEKAQARQTTVDALSHGMSAWVRVNGPETEYWADDYDRFGWPR
jgi:citrate lyase subunit beta/citryl-CoA lyase